MAAAATAMIDAARRAHGKFAGAGFVTDETLLRRYISMGARLILPSSDLNMMVRAATEAPRQCAIASDLAARRMTRSLAVSAHAEPTSRMN